MSDVPVVIMGGSAYTDIDVLACASAYKQCLELQGITAHALIKAPLNQTIPKSIREWELNHENTFAYTEEDECHFILVDFSDPAFIDTVVKLDHVSEVFDHHHGFQDYWKEKIGPRAKIEHIGACATLIWEEFKKANVESKISKVNANLLYTAIIANTLDFKSETTSDRDRIAAEEILPFTKLPNDWKEKYYTEIEEAFLENCLENLLKDTKQVSLKNDQFNFAQIELFSAKSFLKSAEEILSNLSNENAFSDKWIVNMVSIEEGKCYLYCNDAELKTRIIDITSAESTDTVNLLTTPRLWLRKEILKGFHEEREDIRLERAPALASSASL